MKQHLAPPGDLRLNVQRQALLDLNSAPALFFPYRTSQRLDQFCSGGAVRALLSLARSLYAGHLPHDSQLKRLMPSGSNLSQAAEAHLHD
jgi:hypothetical protein